eukprot:2892697-Amphidinium_carterae.1
MTKPVQRSDKLLQSTIATKGEPQRFLQTNIKQNQSKFEAWRALHATYDHGLQAQQLSQLREPRNHVECRACAVWFDGIFQYDDHAQTQLTKAM